MNLFDLLIQFLKTLEIKYYLIFAIGYLTGCFLTWKVILFIVVILFGWSIIHRNSNNQSQSK